MQVTPHVYVMHIDDDSVYHPGGSNNYFVGDPREEMLLIDTGDQQREWTRSILDYYARLGRPKISAVLLTGIYVSKANTTPVIAMLERTNQMAVPTGFTAVDRITISPVRVPSPMSMPSGAPTLRIRLGSPGTGGRGCCGATGKDTTAE